MKAYRNIAGQIREIQVDVDLSGAPILPPDTTVDARPQPQPGHYVTVVGSRWVQIPITEQVVSFETKKADKLAAIQAFRDAYVDQPVEFQGVVFDADDTARHRLTQALVMARELEFVPPTWITYANTEFPLADIDALRGLVGAVTSAFSTRFYEATALRAAAVAATNEQELDAVVIPTLNAPGSVI